MIAAHVSDFYGETFTAMTVGVGVLSAVVVGGRRAVRAMGWVGIVLGTANTPATLPGLALVSGHWAWVSRRLRYLCAVAVAVTLVVGEAWLRRGGPLAQGYDGESFSYPFGLGVLAILFSFGKGLVFFTPGLVLPIGRRVGGLYDASSLDLRRGYRSLLLFIAGMVLVYASWWDWSGDLYWGPRYFLIAILPASLALAVWLTAEESRLLPNIALLGVLALSVWVGANSTIFEQLKSPRCFPLATPIEDLCRFGVRDSALWYPIEAWPTHLTAAKWFQLGYHAVVFVWLASVVIARMTPALASSVRRVRLFPTQFRW